VNFYGQGGDWKERQGGGLLSVIRAVGGWENHVVFLMGK